MGKTTVAGVWAFKKMVNTPGIGLLLAPTYAQAENTLKSLIKLLEQYKAEWTWNRNPQFAKSDLPSHNNVLSAYINSELKQIQLGSADRYDNLRGGNFSYLIFDEAAMASETSYQTIAPCLRGQGTNFQYQQLLLSTPRGRNWLYNNFCKNTNKNIDVIRAGSAENFIEFTDDKLEFLKSTMSKRMYEQEILGLIVEQNSNAIFYAFDIAKNVIDYNANNSLTDTLKCEYEHAKRLFISLDQNVSPLTGILGVVETGTTSIIHVLDEIYIEDQGNALLMARHINEKLKIKPTRLEVYGDAYGKNRTLVGSNYYDTLFTELKKSGWYIVDKTNQKNPPIYDSAEETNRKLEKVELTIGKHCDYLIRDMEMAKYKENTMAVDKNEYDPHLGDALRYLVWSVRQGSGVKLMNL